MLYKVTLKGERGEEVCYMDDRTLKSMTTDKIIDVEKVNQKPPNKDYDNWRYDRKIL